MKKFLKQAILFLVLFFAGINYAQAQEITEGVSETSTESRVSTEEENKIFKEYSWLKTIINREECEGEKVYVYAFGDVRFVVVEKDGMNTMFASDGISYCADLRELDCLEFYKLEEKLDSWVCEGK